MAALNHGMGGRQTVRPRSARAAPSWSARRGRCRKRTLTTPGRAPGAVPRSPEPSTRRTARPTLLRGTTTVTGASGIVGLGRRRSRRGRQARLAAVALDSHRQGHRRIVGGGCDSALLTTASFCWRTRPGRVDRRGNGGRLRSGASRSGPSGLAWATFDQLLGAGPQLGFDRSRARGASRTSSSASPSSGSVARARSTRWRRVSKRCQVGRVGQLGRHAVDAEGGDEDA